MKLFFDANVIFSAAHRAEGRAQELVALARARRCELVTSRHAMEEARRNLAVKSAGFEDRLASVLAQTALVPEAPAALVEWAREGGLPLKDSPILAAAVHAGADLLVTGDAGDFGRLYGRTLRGVLIVPPVRALDIVLRDSGV
ncbi:MAG: PIN domain-containing protein [Burkholderiales bacterium]|nr:PIN domain-containing protein [Burkholderiales bacterium]